MRDGLKCPECGSQDLPVFYTRNKFGRVVRMRKCAVCSIRLLTAERIVSVVPKKEAKHGAGNQTVGG
jgi:transcriptional regulator NrdR family protein